MIAFGLSTMEVSNSRLMDKAPVRITPPGPGLMFLRRTRLPRAPRRFERLNFNSAAGVTWGNQCIQRGGTSAEALAAAKMRR